MGPAPEIYPGHPILHAQREQVGWQGQAGYGTGIGLAAFSSGRTEHHFSRHSWAAT